MKRTFWQKLGDILSGRTIIEKHAEQAVRVLQVIKNIAESPLADAATQLTKTPIDNIVLDRVKALIPRALLYANLAADFSRCLQKPTEIDRINCIFATLQKLPKSERNRYYLTLAKDLLNTMLKDDKIQLNDGDIEKIIEGTYQMQKAGGKL